MALITDAATTWSAPVTLTQNEIWQTRSGTVYLTATPGAAPDDGLFLREATAITVSAGTEIRYRKEGTTPTVIVRGVI